MRKLKYHPGGMRAIADTGLKSFDGGVDYVGTGNVCSSVQRSLYIRPYVETECNGFSFAPGVLRNADLAFVLRERRRIPEWFLQLTLRETETQQRILYEFRNPRAPMVYGFVLTDCAHELLDYALAADIRKDYRYMRVIEWCASHVCNNFTNSTTPSKCPM